MKKEYIKPILEDIAIDAEEDMMIITATGEGIITDNNNNTDSNINVNLDPVSPGGGISPAKYFGYYTFEEWAEDEDGLM